MADAEAAQRAAISTAIHRVFLASVSLIAVTLLTKERPLRRTMASPESADPLAEGVSPVGALPNR